MKRVLLVDDSKMTRNMVKMRFPKVEPIAFEIHEADGGKQCLDLYRQAPYDLVLLDLNMPEMDGFQTLQELKKLDATARVVILTADALQKSRDKALELGAAGVISKPPSKEAIITLLEEHLQIRC
ncbi:MAG: response regulator [Pseudomonadota bacterium]